MTTIQLRRGTAAQWATANPVLQEGEPGWDTTNGVLRVGNGTDAWADLASVSTNVPVLLIDTAEDLPPGTPAGTVVVVKS